MVPKSDRRQPGWEDGRPPWNVEFHLWCDELGEQLARLAKRAVWARGSARARDHGLSLTVEACGVPLRGETTEPEAHDAVLGSVSSLSRRDREDVDPALWPRVVWAARATANKAAGRVAGIVPPALSRSPGGVWLVDDGGDLAGVDGTTTARFACGERTNEGAIEVSVDMDLVTTRVVVAGRPEAGARFGWLLRHAGLAMRSWQTEQVRSILADAPQLEGSGQAEPQAAAWPDEGIAEADEREFFLSTVDMEFWHEEPKIESLTEALRGRSPRGGDR